ncbi:MAG: class I SAM-dependent methyltransferase [Patescibacteria group bacterium]|nr:class I SAM-dependent methyltransferase [Patescibacteria group bacterium]MCL5258015.1 class I SAM-dependent methyltransferase [Patescibacteria group bacterium]
MFLKPNRVIDFLTKHLILVKGFRVADFGCGGGYFSALLAQTVGPDGQVFALDFSAEAVKETKELAEVLNLNNINCALVNLERTNLLSESVDLVFISQVLFQNHAEADKRIIDEAKRVLRRKGYVVLVEPDQVHPFLKPFSQTNDYNVVSADQIKAWLAQAGFSLIAAENFDGYHLFAGQVEN